MKVTVVNLGDCRAVLSRGRRAVALSQVCCACFYVILEFKPTMFIIIVIFSFSASFFFFFVFVFCFLVFLLFFTSSSHSYIRNRITSRVAQTKSYASTKQAELCLTCVVSVRVCVKQGKQKHFQHIHKFIKFDLYLSSLIRNFKSRSCRFQRTEACRVSCVWRLQFKGT